MNIVQHPSLDLMPASAEIPHEATVGHDPAGKSSSSAVLEWDNSDSSMSDVEREQHIVDLGRLMLAAYARYEVSSDFQDRAESDRWRSMQAEVIRARSPEQVKRMEAERGLRG